jgi:hypothetical protein
MDIQDESNGGLCRLAPDDYVIGLWVGEEPEDASTRMVVVVFRPEGRKDVIHVHQRMRTATGVKNRIITCSKPFDDDDETVALMEKTCRDLCVEFHWRLYRLVVKGVATQMMEMLRGTPWAVVQEMPTVRRN